MNRALRKTGGCRNADIQACTAGLRASGNFAESAAASPISKDVGKRNRTGGFSRFELLVVITIFGTLLLIFLDRVLVYQEMAEKTAVEATVINIRTSLRSRTTEMLMRHQESQIAGLAGSNPVRWLEAPPSNYIGELRHPRWEDIPPGSWYFDADSGELLYRVQRGKYFIAGASGQKRLRFRVTARIRSADDDSTVTVAEGVNLTLLEPYQWFFKT